jgi:DNA-binding NarL/FixJ family response regulator
MAELRLVIAEDNLLVREGLLSLLISAGDIVPTTACSSLDELYEAVERDDPDVVVTDIRMPPNHRDEGIQAARRFRTTHPRLGVVVLSQFVEPSYALALLEDGTRGRGYVLKDRIDEVDRLAQAIRIVAGGGSFIDDDVVDALVRARTRMVDSPLNTLTSRELEVLAEMATGATNTAIAESLGVSPHSVEKHSTAIFVKLGLGEDIDVNRRVMAVLMFLAGHQPTGHRAVSME